jgi:hypothetical protein
MAPRGSGKDFTELRKRLGILQFDGATPNRLSKRHRFAA